MIDVVTLTATVEERLSAVADPEKAVGMAAYMKTDMPFFGVQKPKRTPILREIVASFPALAPSEYEAAVRALWGRPHREEKYLALGYAGHFAEHVTVEQVDLYRHLIVDGAWWDLVDDVAVHLFGRVLLQDRPRATPIARDWIEAEDMWLRRTSIICQVGHRAAADETLLFDACLATMDEKEFFIRKAIGWALRDHARTAPRAVAAFVARHRARMSGLSYREATKRLG